MVPNAGLMPPGVCGSLMGKSYAGVLGESLVRRSCGKGLLVVLFIKGVIDYKEVFPEVLCGSYADLMRSYAEPKLSHKPFLALSRDFLERWMS